MKNKHWKHPASITLLIWFASICILLPLLYFLAINPQTMLWIEEAHPSAAIPHGHELLSTGKIDEALSEFKKGTDYFKNLYEDSNLNSHKRMYAYGQLCIANALMEKANPDAWRSAISYYDSVINLVPTLSLGQPFLARGDAYQHLGEYKQAIDSYKRVTQYGQAETILQAYFQQAKCFYSMGNKNQTNQIIYSFLRYSPENRLSEPTLQFLDNIGDEGFIDPILQAYCCWLNGLKAKSQELLKDHITNGEKNRFYRYVVDLVQEKPFNTTKGPIDINGFFPPSSGTPRSEKTTFVDIYANQQTPYHLVMELSAPLSDNIAPVLKISYGQEKTISVPYTELQTVSVNIEVSAGKTILTLEVQKPPDTDAIPSIYLHSMQLNPINH